MKHTHTFIQCKKVEYQMKFQLNKSIKEEKRRKKKKKIKIKKIQITIQNKK